MGLEFIESITKNNTESDFVKSINSPVEQPEIYLSKEDSEKYTGMMRELNGEDMPAIETESDLEGADMFESQKIAQENETASQFVNISEALDGNYDINRVKGRAISTANEKLVAETEGYPGFLAASDAIQQLAMNGIKEGKDPSSINEAVIATTHAKQAIFNDILEKTRREAERQGTWQAVKDVGAEIFFGYPEWKRAVKRSYATPEKGTNYIHPVDNTEDFTKMWTEVLVNPSVSPSAYSKELSTFVEYLKATGFSAGECYRALETMYDPDRGMAYFEGITDLLTGTGMVSSGTKGFVKGFKYASATSKSKLGTAVKGTLYGSVRGGTRALVDPFFTVDSFYDAHGSLIKRVFKPKMNTPAERAAFAGNVDKAATEAIKASNRANNALSTAVETSEAVDSKVISAKEAKKIIDKINSTEPLLRNEVGNGQFKLVFHDFLTAAAGPDEALDSVLRTSDVFKRYQRSLRRFSGMRQALREIGVGEILNLENELISGEAVKIVEDMKKKLSSLLAKEIKGDGASEIIKAMVSDFDAIPGTIKNENIRFKESGKIFAVGRYPMEFDSKEAATNLAEILNASSNKVRAQAIPLTSGKYTVEYGMDFKKGLGTLFKERSKTLEDWKASPVMSALFTKTSNPKDINQLVSLLETEKAALRAIGDSTKAITKGLNNEEEEILSTLLDRTVETRRWYDTDTVFELTESEKITDAYEKLMQLDHMAFLNINEGMRLDMARQGCKLLRKLDTGDSIGYGLIIDKPNLLDEVHKRTYVVVDSFTDAPQNVKNLEKEYNNTMKLKELNAKADSGDYVLLDLVYGPNAILKSDNVYYLVKRDSVIADELPLIVANYVPGWRKYYNRSAKYAKQVRLQDLTRETINEATGAKKSEQVTQIIGIRTFAAAEPADLLVFEKNTRAIEEIRKAVAVGTVDIGNGVLSNPKALKLIRELKTKAPYVPFDTVETFVKWADDIGLDYKHIDNALEIVNNGDTLSSYKNMVVPGSRYEDFIGPTVMDKLTKGSPYEGIVHSSELIQNHRSDRTIFSYDFQPMKTVDIRTSIDYLVSDMINYGVIHRFDDFYANRFFEAFKDLNEGKKTPLDFLRQDFTPMMLNGPTKEIRDLAKKAYTAQKNYLFIKETPSKFDQYISKVFEDTMRAAGAIPDALGLPASVGKGARLATGAIMKLKPLKKLRALTCQWMLMLGNYTQLLKNFASPVAMMGLAAPIDTGKAFLHLIPLSLRFAGTDGEAMKLVTKAMKAIGADATTNDILFKNMLKLGIMNKGTLGGFIEGSTTASTLVKANSFFFNTADMWNQIMSGTVALIKNGGDKKLITSSIDLARISELKDTLYLNMGKAGMARAQATEVGKTGLQFLGYVLRTFETLCFDKNLTGLQRASMAVGYSTLFGLTSFAGVKTLSNIWSRFWGAPEEPQLYTENKEWYETARDVFMRGAINTILNRKGIDIDVSGYFDLSVGDNFMKFSEMSLSDAFKASVPSFKVIEDILGGIKDTCVWLHNKYLGDGRYSSFSSLVQLLAAKGELPPVLKRSVTLYNLMQEGEIYSSRGQLTLKDNRALYVVATALGFNQQTTGLVYEKNLKEQLIKDKASEAKKEYIKIYNLALRDQDPNNKAMYEKLLQYTLNGLTGPQQSAIIAAAQEQAVKARMVPLYQSETAERASQLWNYNEVILPDFNIKGEQ